LNGFVTYRKEIICKDISEKVIQRTFM